MFEKGHKINQGSKKSLATKEKISQSNKEFIVFHEDNYYEAWKIISDKHNL